MPKKTIENTLPKGWEQIIWDMAAEGCSDCEIRAALWKVEGKKFCKNKWIEWKEHEKEFNECLEIAKVLCQAWWEEKGRKGIVHGPNIHFETGLWFANMKNRFGWRDQVDHGLAGDITVVFGYRENKKSGNNNGKNRIANSPLRN